MAKLNEKQRKNLDEYLLEKKHLIVGDKQVTTSHVTAWCREAGLGEIDTTNITHRVGPTGTLYKHEWPGSETSRKGRLTDRMQRSLLVEQIELMRIQLCQAQFKMNEAGVTCPGLGAAVPKWTELVAQVKSDLADTDHREPEER